jgi:ATP-dependent DNA helicase
LFCIYLLNMKDLCKEKMEVKAEEDTLPVAENGDSSLISRLMAEEEEKLLEARIKEDEERRKEPQAEAKLNDRQFTKLDELLTQTQMYSDFLLEKMDDITIVSSHALFYHEFL